MVRHRQSFIARCRPAFRAGPASLLRFCRRVVTAAPPPAPLHEPELRAALVAVRRGTDLPDIELCPRPLSLGVGACTPTWIAEAERAAAPGGSFGRRDAVGAGAAGGVGSGSGAEEASGPSASEMDSTRASGADTEDQATLAEPAQLSECGQEGQALIRSMTFATNTFTHFYRATSCEMPLEHTADDGPRGAGAESEQGGDVNQVQAVVEGADSGRQVDLGGGGTWTEEVRCLWEGFVVGATEPGDMLQSLTVQVDKAMKQCSAGSAMFTR